jgi:hypothetical protein
MTHRGSLTRALRRYGPPRPRIRDDLVAEVHTFSADRHAARTGDQQLDLILPLIAEAAFQVVAIHRRPLLIVVGHHYRPKHTDNPDYAEKRPADDEHQGDDAGCALRREPRWESRGRTTVRFSGLIRTSRDASEFTDRSEQIRMPAQVSADQPGLCVEDARPRRVPRSAHGASCGAEGLSPCRRRISGG